MSLDIFDSQKTLYVDVIAPIYIPRTLTYSIPIEWHDHIQVGMRVEIAIKSKHHTAIVYKIHQKKPQGYIIKPIIFLIDQKPILFPVNLQLWEWMWQYYMTAPGSIMQAALPSAFKLNSESLIQLVPDLDYDALSMDIEEIHIIETLHKNPLLKLEDVQNLLQRKNVMPIIKDMSQKGWILIDELLKEKYKPLTTEVVTIKIQKSEWETTLNELNKSPKQQAILLAFIEMQKKNKFVFKKELLARASANTSQLNNLIIKNILITETITIDRIKSTFTSSESIYTLTPTQSVAYNSIKENENKFCTHLLHGVTGSGKTNIYIHLAKEKLAQGKQVLYLLPEIALTYQITQKLQQQFPSQLAVYHSKFNDQERVEIWNKIASHEKQIVIGARSALFLPFDNLGLIIIDEEHDSSYKQYEDPCYHARDTALVLAQKMNAQVILGSATPSLESLLAAQTGKYNYILLTERYNHYTLPQIEIVNILDEQKRKLMKSHFSSVLIESMRTVLARGEQIILFQNRRGFAPHIECNDCAYIPRCKNCDVSLTFHKQTNEMRCHYCSYTVKPNNSCDVCGSNDLQMKGFGTERIEEDLILLLPQAKIARMDLDTVRNKNAHQHLLYQFEKKEINILVGTQMVTKGLDFANVTLVGILNADQLLYYPDFRAYERAFQLMSQVAGRSGRSALRGRVIIQSRTLTHPILQNIIAHDYAAYSTHELHQRLSFKYPPYYRLIEITLMHKKEELIIAASHNLCHELQKELGSRIMGVNIPHISRIRNQNIRKILIKMQRESDNIVNIKNYIRDRLDQFSQITNYKSIQVRIDVDPS